MALKTRGTFTYDLHRNAYSELSNLACTDELVSVFGGQPIIIEVIYIWFLKVKIAFL